MGDYAFIKQRLAPCGLHCGKCFAFVDGDVYLHSRKLKDSLGNFDAYAKRFVDMLDEPVFLKYTDFKEFLNMLATISCKGCREEKCKLFRNCGVRPCIENKGVDYCFQCDEFPCSNTSFDQHLYKRYIEINELIREIGVIKYYDEIKDRPRY